MNKEAAISFRLDDKTIAELDRLADLQGKARTVIIREAISKHLKVAKVDQRAKNVQVDFKPLLVTAFRHCIRAILIVQNQATSVQANRDRANSGAGLP